MSDINLDVNILTGEPDVQELQLTGSIIQSEEQQKEVVDFLSEEINKITSNEERDRMVQKWNKWRRQSEGRPEKESKTYPWADASNVTVPLALTNANGIYAVLKASFGQRKPFWDIETADKGLKKAVKALRSLLDLMAESRYHLNLRETNNQILYDIGRLGTQFINIPWITDQYSFKRKGPSGSMELVTQTRMDSPTIIPIALEDFITRPYWNDIQRMPYVGHRVYLMEHEIRQRMQQGIFNENAEAILKREPDQLDENREAQLGRMGITPGSDTGLFAIYEMYHFADIDGDGVPEDIIVWLDPETGTMLRSEYNDLGIRPKVRIPYFGLPGELYAMGTGWMTESLQDEIDALHNMRIDGTHISMLQMYVTKKGGSIPEGMEFRPLMQIPTNNPKEDFLPIKFPDIGFTTLQAEVMAKEYADRATGVSDAMMGFESRATSARTTATGTMFLAQQNSRVSQAIIETMQDAFGDAGQITTFQLVRNSDRVKKGLIRLLPEEEQIDIMPILDLQVEDIPSALSFSVETTDVDKTEEVKRQNLLTLTQLYTMYAKETFQLLPLVYAPGNNVPQEIKEVASKFFVGSTTLMEDIFRFFDVRDPDSYLPYIDNLRMMHEAIEAQRNQQLGSIRNALSQNSQQLSANPGTASSPAGAVNTGGGLGNIPGPNNVPAGGVNSGLNTGGESQ